MPQSSVIDTKHAADRRDLHFDTLDDILADAQRLHELGYRRVGNWSLGQACTHLTIMMHGGIDGVNLSVPVPMRWFGRLFKRHYLRRGFPAGLPLKGKFAVLVPNPVQDDEGLRQLDRAIQRLHRTPPTQPSPVIGPMSPDDWRKFHCRHAELHLGFLIPFSSRRS